MHSKQYTLLMVCCEQYTQLTRKRHKLPETAMWKQVLLLCPLYLCLSPKPENQNLQMHPFILKLTFVKLGIMFFFSLVKVCECYLVIKRARCAKWPRLVCKFLMFLSWAMRTFSFRTAISTSDSDRWWLPWGRNRGAAVFLGMKLWMKKIHF